MTTLVVEELKTTLSQDFKLNLNQRAIISAVRPYIYMHNAPAGTFTLSIKQSSTTLWSQNFTSQAIKDALETTDNYAHIKLNLLPDYLKLSKGTYTAELSSSGYTPTSDSFIGWIKPHEDLYFDVYGTPSSDSENPLGLELITVNNVERIR